jgi:hypothetical protein
MAQETNRVGLLEVDGSAAGSLDEYTFYVKPVFAIVVLEVNSGLKSARRTAAMAGRVVSFSTMPWG